jgi:hypothetical protein
VDTVALIARLKPGCEERAAQLLSSGPPFDPGERGLSRHSVYLSAGEVVFVFEGDEVEWIVEEMVSEPTGGSFAAALDAWRELVDGPPRIGRAAYTWERPR